jgi:hypothetical protein
VWVGASVSGYATYRAPSQSHDKLTQLFKMTSSQMNTKQAKDFLMRRQTTEQAALEKIPLSGI